MGFIERLEQEKTAKVLRKQQLEDQQEAHKKAQETERLRKEAEERERHARRRKQAEKFDEESGVIEAVLKLGKFLGKSVLGRTPPSYPPRDSDSVIRKLSWDYKFEESIANHKVTTSEKIIAVETDPDGVIIFHGGWFGSTTIPLTQWRVKDKEQIFDRALEKAYRNPRTNRSSFRTYPLDRGSE